MDEFNNIVQLSYAYFANKKVTPEEIRTFITRMKAAFSEQHIDEQKLFTRLETIYSVVIKESLLALEDNEGHEPWFNPTTNLPEKRKFEWHFWEHFKNYLLYQKGRQTAIIEKLDNFSSEILSRLEDPLRSGAWDRRGMVMGNVQAGKTENYTGLICKALDAGYKLIVILAGVHNSLRSQTQDRLNEELLGYDMDRVQRLTGQEKQIGVRRMFSDHRTVNTLTSSSQEGDFNRSIAMQVGILPSVTGDPIILVIKKIVPIMNNLIRWLTSLPDLRELDGRKVIPDIPLLVIDDECDFASVNTKKPEFDENGRIIEDWDPAKTNQMIRRLLFLFRKSAYIGYTATPYANIFIHKDHFHPKYGDDLFPRHFMISLPQPSNYIGPESVFGMEGDHSQTNQTMEELPLLRYVSDNEDKIPGTHRKELIISQLPESLIEALKSFILCCAARRIRQVGSPHNSMLVHVTRFIAVQQQIKELVEKELRRMVARIMSGSDKLLDFKELWESDFVATSRTMLSLGFTEAFAHPWQEIRKELFETVKKIKVKNISGESTDVLDYIEADAIVRQRLLRGEPITWNEKGINVIAIGGDKLSRGLTLYGLSVSYYLRASRMYDTLMQMGRWFGYRDGYNDLCRIYTTAELAEWYRYIALANQELRNELEYMIAINSEPEKYGLKVRSHPGRLAVTSAGKSRNKEKLSLSFEGQLRQTIVFDPRNSENNRRTLHNLVEQIGRDCSREIIRTRPRFQWDNVEPEIIINFLRAYQTHQTAQKIVDPEKIAEFIERQISIGELTQWHVVKVSNNLNDAPHNYMVGKYNIGCVLRRPYGPIRPEYFSIKVLTSPADEALDLTEEERQKALDFDRQRGKKISGDLPTSLAIRQARPETRGLFLIYLPACNDSQKTYGMKGEEIVGWAVSFPRSAKALPIEYWVNPVYMEEYSYQ